MTNRSRSRAAFLILVLAAVILHAYEHGVLASGTPSLGWFAWSLSPYLLAVAIFAASKNGLPAIIGAAIAFAFDLTAHYEVFVHPTGSTAPLALIFVPLWNTVIFVPIAALVVWLILRRQQRLKKNAL